MEEEVLQHLHRKFGNGECAQYLQLVEDLLGEHVFFRAAFGGLLIQETLYFLEAVSRFLSGHFKDQVLHERLNSLLVFDRHVPSLEYPFQIALDFPNELTADRVVSLHLDAGQGFSQVILRLRFGDERKKFAPRTERQYLFRVIGYALLYLAQVLDLLAELVE